MNGIDEIYENNDIQKEVTRNDYKNYFLSVRQKTFNRFGTYKKYKSKRYEVIVLNNVVVYVNPKIYNEIYCNYTNDELLHYYNTTDITTELNNNDESSIVNGKIVVDIHKTEQNFRRVIFDNGYKTLKNKNVFTSQINEEKFKLDFKIKNEFEHLDFSGIK